MAECIAKSRIVPQSADVGSRKGTGPITDCIHDAKEPKRFGAVVDQLVRRQGSDVDGIQKGYVESPIAGNNGSLPSERHDDMRMIMFFQARIATGCQFKIAKVKISRFLTSPDEDATDGLSPIGGCILIGVDRDSLPTIISAKPVTTASLTHR